MRLLRLAAGPNPSVSIILPPSWEYPILSPQVIVGSNGSGKSLLVSALLALFVSGEDRIRRCKDLRQSGIEKIELDFELDGRIAHVECDTEIAEPTVHWEAIPGSPSGNHNTRPQPAAEADAEPELFDGCPGSDRLFRDVHIILAGKSALSDFPTIQEIVAHVLCAPIEKELAEWLDREKSLLGNGDSVGSLEAARAHLESAESEVRRIENLWCDYEAMLERKRDIEERLTLILRDRDVFNAELSELDRLCSLAERAQRLDTWTEEIEQENRKVVALREQHAAHQSRLDSLEEQFRGTPDNFAVLLSEFSALRKNDQDLADELSDWSRKRENALRRRDELAQELDRLSPPVKDEAGEFERLHRESATVNAELTELLRGRIELVRRREGARQKLQQDFSQFIGLDPSTRRALDRLLMMDSPWLMERDYSVGNSTRTERESRIEEIRRTLRDKFAGFENLPERTPDIVRELFELRQHAATKVSDIEALQKRSRELHRKLQPLRAAAVWLPAGGAGFAAGTFFASWDIGLVSGLAASGLALLIMKLALRRVDSEIESLHEAEEMMQAQWKAAVARIALLEESLRPLAQLKSMEGALSRYADYRNYTHEMESLQIDRESSENSSTPEIRALLNEIRAQLPIELQSASLMVVQRSYGEFREREKQVLQLDEQWNAYSDGGDTALRIRELEDKTAQLKQRQSELAAEADKTQQAYESRKADLLAQTLALESSVSSAEATEGIEEKRLRIRNRMEELDRICQGLLNRSDGELLRNEWHERESLQSKLREIRNNLSGYQTYDELRAREALLREEAAEVRQKLMTIDPLYLLQGNAAHYVAKYHAHRQSARDQSDACERSQRVLHEEMNAMDLDGRLAALTQEPQREGLRRELTERQGRVEEIERNLTTTRELIASIRSELDDTAQSAEQTLAANINLQVRVLSNNRYSAVWHRGGEWQVETTEGGTRRMDTLSDGTQDLLWLAVRVGILDTIQNCDHSPVIWDEPLWRLDEAHLLQVRDAIQRLSMTRQVILLTRQASLAGWGTAFRMSPAGVHRSLEPKS